MPTSERKNWSIDEETEGQWSVYRNGRVVRYDCDTIEEALRLVRRRDGRGLQVKVHPLRGVPEVRRS